MRVPFSGVQIGLYLGNAGLTRIALLDDASALPINRPASVAVIRIVDRLMAYFESPDVSFEGLPLDRQGTAFQHRVWAAIARIPVGQLRCYSALAKALNTSPRAVGNACRANPVPLVIPCHRVVSRHGLGGYAGQTSGRLMAFKRDLLAHEGAKFNPQ